MGNTSGRIGGKEYFHCPPHYGRVVKLSDIHAVRNPRVGISLCVLVVTVGQTRLANTVEPRYNKGQRLAKYVRYNEILLYQGSFLYILLLLSITGATKSVRYAEVFVKWD